MHDVKASGSSTLSDQMDFIYDFIFFLNKSYMRLERSEYHQSISCHNFVTSLSRESLPLNLKINVEISILGLVCKLFLKLH